MIKACIFDLDGTLTDTLESLAYSVKETMKEMGIEPITADQCRSFVGDGARCLMERSLLAAGEEYVKRLEESMQIYGRIFDANCTYHVSPYEGICETLKELKERDMKLAVVSNKPHKQTVKVVGEIFGEGVFDEVQGQQEGIARKPAPDAVLAVLDKLGLTREEVLYIGDSEVDVKTGANADVQTIAVEWGFRSRDTLITAGAQTVIEKPEELLQFV